MDSEPWSFWISTVIMASCRINEFFLIIFLTKQYFGTSSQFKSAYFLFLQIGYMIDFASGICWIIYLITSANLTYMMCFEWYETYFATIWNSLLAFNRCTVIMFPLLQNSVSLNDVL